MKPSSQHNLRQIYRCRLDLLICTGCLLLQTLHVLIQHLLSSQHLYLPYCLCKSFFIRKKTHQPYYLSVSSLSLSPSGSPTQKEIFLLSCFYFLCFSSSNARNIFFCGLTGRLRKRHKALLHERRQPASCPSSAGTFLGNIQSFLFFVSNASKPARNQEGLQVN